MAESEKSWVDDKQIRSSPTGSSPVIRHEPQWADYVIPPRHKHRTLIVCFDGPGDKFDADVRLLTSCRILPGADGEP